MGLFGFIYAGKASETIPRRTFAGWAGAGESAAAAFPRWDFRKKEV